MATTPPEPRWDFLDVSALLTLEQVDRLRFRSRFHDPNKNGLAFGGQVMGQALAAAQAVAPGRRAATLQSLFLHGATLDVPIDFEAEVLQDGRRFTSCHVRGTQKGRPVAAVNITFQTALPGSSHARPAPEVPDIDDLPSLDRLDEGGVDWSRYQKPCLTLHIVGPEHYLTRTSERPAMAYWLKLRQGLPDDDVVHERALAYLSDYWINSAAISHHVPVGEALGRKAVASLNHSLWFHRPFRADRPLLFVCESPSLESSRTLTFAGIYDQDRRLVASVAQDCLFADRN